MAIQTLTRFSNGYLNIMATATSTCTCGKADCSGCGGGLVSSASDKAASQLLKSQFPNYPRGATIVRGTGKDIRLTPGEEIVYIARIFAGTPIEVERLLPDKQTLRTKYNHCLKVDQPIHLCITSGFCTSEELNTCLFIESIPNPNEFKLRNGADEVYTFEPTDIKDPDPDDATDPTTLGTPGKAWIVEAADLTGYRGRLRIVLGGCRDPKLISVGAIAHNSSQMQLKGDHTGLIQVKDKVELKDFTGTVTAIQKASFNGDCYTIVQTKETNVGAIGFTENVIAMHHPVESTITATAPSLACGWVSVSIPGHRTKELCRYDKDIGYNTLAGSWDFALMWGGSDLPTHIKDDLSNAHWITIFDQGALLV